MLALALNNSRDLSLLLSKYNLSCQGIATADQLRRDRVMQTVAQSKTLPPDMASQRLGNVNLFMRAIGLDVDWLG